MIIEYDGSRYHGFQKQQNAHTIQAELEKQIERLTGEIVHVDSAGRTDAGVHACGQVIAFDTAATIPGDRWKLALNTFLPGHTNIAQYRSQCQFSSPVSSGQQALFILSVQTEERGGFSPPLCSMYYGAVAGGGNAGSLPLYNRKT